MLRLVPTFHAMKLDPPARLALVNQAIVVVIVCDPAAKRAKHDERGAQLHRLRSISSRMV